MARRILRSTPVITTSAYTAKDALGPLTELVHAARNGGGGKICNITMIDKDAEVDDFKVWIFDDEVTAEADADPMDFSDADLAAHLIGVVAFAEANFVVLGSNVNAAASVAVNSGNGMGFKLPVGKSSLWYQVESVDTPTFTAATDVTLIFDIDSE
jgi:hypothetical protein